MGLYNPLQKISEIADVIRGLTFAKADGVLLPQKNYFPVIRAGNIQDQLILDKDLIWISKSKIKKNQLIKKNDIIMCTSSGSPSVVGKCAKAFHDWSGTFGAFCVGLRTDESICNSSYLFHYLRSKKFKRWAKRSSGANIKNIRKTDLENFLIPLPLMEHQNRIAAILDKANAIRRKREKAIELADEFLRSVFLDMFGDPMFNPKKFHLIQLDSLFSIGKPGSKCGPFGSALKKHEYVNSGIPVWTMDNIQRSGFDKKGCLFITKEKYNELKAYEVEEGDIIISRAGTVGKMCVVPNLFSSSIISTNLIRLSLNTHKVKPEFFTYLMSNFKGRVGRLATGKDGSYTYMNTGILKELKIPLPPIELQTKFLALHDKISVVKQKHVDLYNDTLFNSLSQRAFRGGL